MEDTDRAPDHPLGGIVRRRRGPVLAGAVAACVASAAFAPPSQATDAEPATPAKPIALNIPYQGLGFELTCFWAAIDDGLFRRYGIDATTEYIPNSPVIVATLMSGETLFASVGEDAVINADLNGADIVILAAGPEKFSFIIYGKPSLHTLADLKGKTLAISGSGTSTDFNARYALRTAGLVPGTDVTLLPVGSQANRVTDLAGGVVDAAIVGFPGTEQARKLGFNALYDMADSDLVFYSTTIVGRRSWIKTHPDETLNMLRGYVAGIADVSRNKASAVAALAKYTKTTDPEMLEAGYRAMLKILDRVPVPRTKPVQTALDAISLPAAKTADASRFIDPSWIERLQQEGFIDRLYR
jgi:NitT/TauT family transport system substrate-binding protein